MSTEYHTQLPDHQDPPIPTQGNPTPLIELEMNDVSTLQRPISIR